MGKKNFQTKNSFTRQEVEEYTKRMLTSSEVTICEQKDRIVELKIEIDNLTRQNGEQDSKIKQLKKAMAEVERINKQTQKESALQSKLVANKIQQFGYKWKCYFSELFSEVDALKDNASAELFANEIDELVSQVVEATMQRASLDDKFVPIASEICISEDDWISSRVKSLSTEPRYTLSGDSEKKYKKILDRLKNKMVYTSESDAREDKGFDIQEALNPKDSLDKIIDDLK